MTETLDPVAPGAPSAPPATSSNITLVPLLRGLRVGLFATASVGVVGWNLPTLLANLDVYRPLGLELFAYGCMIAITVAGGWVVLTDRPWGRLRWPLLGGVIIACALATAAVPAPELLGPAHWSWELVAWFCAAMLTDLPIRWLTAALTVHLTVVLTQLGIAGRLDRESVISFSIVAMLNAGGAFALGFTAIFARRVATTAERMSEQEASLTTANRIADGLQNDRRARYADIAATAGPLLEGLRTGALSPEDPMVQRRCAIEAARLRRQMAERDDVPDAFGHELQTCIDVAQRAGVEVQVSMRGARPDLELPVRRALTENVSAMLASARHAARVTVVGMGGEVVVSVVTDAESDPADDLGQLTGAAAAAVDTELLRRGGRAWLTVKARAA